MCPLCSVSSDKCSCSARRYLLSWQKWPSATCFWVRVCSPLSSAAIWETISHETSFIGATFPFPCSFVVILAPLRVIETEGIVKPETLCPTSSSSAQFLPASSAAINELKSVVGLLWHSCVRQQGLAGNISDGSLTVIALIVHLELGNHLLDQSRNRERTWLWPEGF